MKHPKTKYLITETTYNNQTLSIYVEYTNHTDLHISRIFDIHTGEDATLPKEECETILKTLKPRIALYNKEAQGSIMPQIAPKTLINNLKTS
jgi:hypothetical protein